jgi:hypothetical protein
MKNNFQFSLRHNNTVLHKTLYKNLPKTMKKKMPNLEILKDQQKSNYGTQIIPFSKQSLNPRDLYQNHQRPLKGQNISKHLIFERSPKEVPRRRVTQPVKLSPYALKSCPIW